MGQPWEAEDHREVGQRHQLEGNVLFVLTMDAHTGGKEVGDRGCGTAVDELNWDGVRVGLCLQLVGGCIASTPAICIKINGETTQNLSQE